MTLLSGKHHSLPFPNQLPSLLEGVFEQTWPLSRALNLEAYVASELQRNKEIVRCAELSTEVPGHCQEQLTETLIVRLLKKHFCTPILDFENLTEYD